MGRPSKFNAEYCQTIVDAIRAGESREAAARAAGVSLRTLAGWIARGRAGEPGFREFVIQFHAADEAKRRRRCEARWTEYRIESKVRWGRFKASREGWWLRRLGPAAFWRQRVVWLMEHNRDSSLGPAVAQLIRARNCTNG